MPCFGFPWFSTSAFFLTSCGWPFLLAMAVNVTMSPERGSCIWRPIHGPRLPGESLWCEQVNKFKSTAPTLKSWICLWWTQTSFWVCAKILGGRVWPFTRPHALIFRADFGVHVRCYGRSGEMMRIYECILQTEQIWICLGRDGDTCEIESSFCGNRTFEQAALHTLWSRTVKAWRRRSFRYILSVRHEAGALLCLFQEMQAQRAWNSFTM